MHNIRQLYRKHFGRAVVYTLLSLFLCMAGAGKAAAAVEFTYKPQVKVISTNYTNSGTEVTLKLWMYNFAGGSSRFIKNRTVDLYIDDQPQSSLLLNNLWQKISNAEEYEMIHYVTPGPVSDKRSISFNYKDIGTAQFYNLQIYQYSENDGKGTQAARCSTIELKLSFDNSFSYYGHKISVRGLWQDNSGAPITKYVSLDNTIGGYVRPTKLKVRSYDISKMRLSWEIQDYNGLASKEGSWKIYKCENGKREKIGSMVYNDNFFNFDIQKKKYNCSATYDVTFQPRQFTASDTICGLTTSVAATGHKLNADDICQYCNHSFFRYTTSDGKTVNNISNSKQFGANIVAHSVVDGKCVIEFDAPITKIPDQAFFKCKNLTGDLVIPNSVTEIGEQAFSDCTGFNGTLTLSNKLETIGELAFHGCTGFTGSLTLPSSVTTIGKTAFVYGGKTANSTKVPVTVIYSDDKGENWTTCELDNIYNADYYYVKFFDVNNGVVICGYAKSNDTNESSRIYKTSNGGESWETVGSGPATNIIKGVVYVTADVGFFCYDYVDGMDSNLYKTDDGGKTFAKVILEAQELDSSAANSQNQESSSKADGTSATSESTEQLKWNDVYKEALLPVLIL